MLNLISLNVGELPTLVSSYGLCCVMSPLFLWAGIVMSFALGVISQLQETETEKTQSPPLLWTCVTPFLAFSCASIIPFWGTLLLPLGLLSSFVHLVGHKQAFEAAVKRQQGLCWGRHSMQTAVCSEVLKSAHQSADACVARALRRAGSDIGCKRACCRLHQVPPRALFSSIITTAQGRQPMHTDPSH
jgi:hypothetical protein